MVDWQAGATTGESRGAGWGGRRLGRLGERGGRRRLLASQMLAHDATFLGGLALGTVVDGVAEDGEERKGAEAGTLG